MQVSVVVCTYALDSYEHFREAVDSVFDQTYDDVELVIVVDNAPAVYDRIIEESGDLNDAVVHCTDENRGLTRSRNLGAELATGDVVAFIDDDAVADRRWVERLVAAYEDHDAIAVGGRMAPRWEAGEPTALPPEFYWLVGETHDGFADGPDEVRNTFGSTISFRRDVFLELGGFDPAIGGRKGDSNLQGEEAELCVRMRRRYGRGIWYDPDAVVEHKVFEYRTDPRWLLGRAFWQGYSKRAMAVLVVDSTDEESEFLRSLVVESIPDRIRGMVGGPVRQNALQLLSLFVLTVAVGLGYLYGVTRWRPQLSASDRRQPSTPEQRLSSVPDRRRPSTSDRGQSSTSDRQRSAVSGRRQSAAPDRRQTANTAHDDTGERLGVCVVTHPLSDPGETATRTLLDVLSVHATVSLITADLPTESAMRDRYDVVELTEKGAGQSNAAVAAVRFVANQLRMCRELARTDEDIVLFFGATSYLLPILFARAIGKTVALEPRGDVPRSLRLNWERQFPAPLARALALPVRVLERIGYSAADAVIAYTPGMARELGLERDSDTLFTNGARYVDTDRFRPTTPFDERDRTVGFVGRLDQEKGIHTLIQVARELPDDVTFRFVGDGALREQVETALADEIERGSVVVTGWVDHDEVPRELNALRLLVMPSEPTEGLPTTILESLACGTPVYASPVSGVPDVVRDGETGLHMDDREGDVIADTIVSALDGGRLPRMSQDGRSLIVREYDFDAAVDRYGQILHALGEGAVKKRADGDERSLVDRQ
ncbi:group 1 glycosyl transferase [Halovivax asiaticus JCM 14624]|uniref:Group 1 glycosyl transferase n=1 Tax=Halovivax asiaticus JCM 14624 TaxID=1227490 RepID=M0BW70_9EURY|nr:group 1 glycosyl transferase [Halovivax asiaticus JCM 14624]